MSLFSPVPYSNLCWVESDTYSVSVNQHSTEWRPTVGQFTSGSRVSGYDVGLDVDTELWVVEVLGQVQSALDGTRVPGMSQLTVEGFIGLTGPDSPQLITVSTEGSMLDPDHTVWDVDDKADSWVTTEIDARLHIQQAI